MCSAGLLVTVPDTWVRSVWFCGRVGMSKLSCMVKEGKVWLQIPGRGGRKNVGWLTC